MKFLILLFLLVSCGSSNSPQTSTILTTTTTSDTISGYWYNNDRNDLRIYIEVLSQTYIRVYYADMINLKKYKIEGYFILKNNILSITNIIDTCGKGNQYLTFSRYNQQTIYLNGVEYVDTTTPPEQWTFWSFSEQCF